VIRGTVRSQTRVENCAIMGEVWTESVILSYEKVMKKCVHSSSGRLL
jgi:hypothetical protein